MTEKDNPYDVKIGEVWVDNDKRYSGQRKIKILSFGMTKYGWPAARIESLLTGRKSWARLNRFSGRENYGYSKVTDNI
jgi:hypothetical protein